MTPSSDLSSFSRCKGEKVHHRLHINYQDQLIMPSAHSQAKVICHSIFFLCSSVFYYLCSFFFSHHLVACSFFKHFTLASLTNLTLFSPTFRLFIQHISKFCYFFLFLSLKAVTSSLFLKPKTSS